MILTVILTLCFSYGGVALADDSITTSVKVSPSSLPSAGTANVTVTIKNNGDPISDVVLKYPSPTDTEIPIGNMATGDTQTHDNPSWNITDEMLGKSMAFKYRGLPRWLRQIGARSRNDRPKESW